MTTQLFTAFYGLLFSTGRGLIFFLPLICLFPVAYCKFRSSHPNEARFFLSLILIQFIFLLPLIDWHGGSSWGPRYLLPIIPFCIFPLGALAKITWIRRLAIVGLLMNLPGILMNPHLFVRFAQNKKIGAPSQRGGFIFRATCPPDALIFFWRYSIFFKNTLRPTPSFQYNPGGLHLLQKSGTGTPSFFQGYG